jgi:hypothetical protein
MNCKQGDLALVVGSLRNNGKVVTCLELLAAGAEYVEESVGPLWRVDRPLEYTIDALPGIVATKYLAPDRKLLPIRPRPCPECTPEPTSCTSSR